MNTNTQPIASNDLRYTITTNDVAGNTLIIDIRLNDECKNGHQDFAITGSIYKKGKPKIDKYYIAGGCIHDDILKVRPDLKIFVTLHLCDYKGIPMHAIANGYYHLTRRFSNISCSDPKFMATYCEYYRVTEEQYKVLKLSRSETDYANNLIHLGVLKQWGIEANEAISILEGYTGKKFIVDSKRTQFNMPTE